MGKWKLELEYVGTRYRGWQEQANARTVQGALRQAAEDYFGERVEIVGSGRTDAGVHALQQVAHLRARKAVEPGRLQREMNDRLPSDINILNLIESPPQFHARHSATERFYLYQISTKRTAFGKPYVWWVKDRLDLSAMKNAAGMFVGKHDFAGFTEKDGSQTSTLVVVTVAELERCGDLILFRIGASHFVWKMVRRIVGTLVELGRGLVRLEQVRHVLESADGPTAQWTAPPSGLFLERVCYPGDPVPGRLAPASLLGKRSAR